MWEIKPKDGLWLIYLDGKPAMKSAKLCRVFKEYKKIKEVGK